MKPPCLRRKFFKEQAQPVRPDHPGGKDMNIKQRADVRAWRFAEFHWKLFLDEATDVTVLKMEHL